ncbi:hypothetical protein D3C75_737750 [compost metagenome]
MQVDSVAHVAAIDQHEIDPVIHHRDGASHRGNRAEVSECKVAADGVDVIGSYAEQGTDRAGIEPAPAARCGSSQQLDARRRVVGEWVGRILGVLLRVQIHAALSRRHDAARLVGPAGQRDLHQFTWSE